MDWNAAGMILDGSADQTFQLQPFEPSIWDACPYGGYSVDARNTLLGNRGCVRCQLGLLRYR